jgi:hypothetical protein
LSFALDGDVMDAKPCGTSVTPDFVSTFFTFVHVHRVSLSVSSERAAGEKTRSNIILHSHILFSITFIVFVVTSSIFHFRLGNEGEPDNEPGQRMFVVPGNV